MNITPITPAPAGPADARFAALHHALAAEGLLTDLDEQPGRAKLTAMSAQVMALRARAHAELAAFWLGAATDDDARRVERDGVTADAGDVPLFSEAIDALGSDG